LRFKAKEKGSLGDRKYSIVQCPFTGKEAVILSTYQPDVGIIHSRSTDRRGNAQTWGTYVGFKSKIQLERRKIVVSAGEIMDDGVVTHDPDGTVVPAFKVCAVVEEPWSAHPEAMCGHYDNDLAFRIFYEHSTHLQIG